MVIRVRYFAAARAAAGRDEEKLDVPAGTSLEQLLQELRARHPADGNGQPSLRSIIERSSFLRNEVALRDRSLALHTEDVIDVLPPFAGG